MDEKIKKQFEEWGKTPPTHEPHGTEEDIKKNLQTLYPNSWSLEGNLLRGQTAMGELVQTIPPNYILKGTDERGLPILEKIVI